MQLYAVRLKEGQDLKQGITDYVLANKLSSATILTAVGSLSKATIRMAGAAPDKQDIRAYDGSFEIVSLVGTIAQDGGAHLHMAISDANGQVMGGHLKEGSIVHTTVELVIANDSGLTFKRVLDDDTGFDELQIVSSK
jgi:predicted DNA-binding protein with PD1-like motif